MLCRHSVEWENKKYDTEIIIYLHLRHIISHNKIKNKHLVCCFQKLKETRVLLSKLEAHDT